MITLNYSNVKDRLSNLSCVYEGTIAFPDIILKTFLEKYNYKIGLQLLENWSQISMEGYLIDNIIKVYDSICENDSINNIVHAAQLIEGKIIPKLRDGQATKKLNNYKLGKFKIANTKVKNRAQDNKDAVKNAIANKGKVVDTLHPNRKYKYDMFGKKKEEVVAETIDIFLDTQYVNDQCDRVLENYGVLKRAFNIDSIFRKVPNLNRENNMELCIYEFCNIVDTYRTNLAEKYLCVLETAYFLFNKNAIDIDKAFLIEKVTDYFCINNPTIDQYIPYIQAILENGLFFGVQDLNTTTQYMLYPELFENKEVTVASLLESSREKKLKKFQQKMAEFKKSKSKSPVVFKNVIESIYADSKESILDNQTEILNVFRILLLGVLSGVTLGPFLGILVIITDSFIQAGANRSHAKKLIRSYEKEISFYKTKSRDAKDDKYDKIIEKLEKELERIKQYEESLYSDKENEKRIQEFVGMVDIDNTSELISYVESVSTIIDHSMNSNNIKSIQKTVGEVINQISDSDIYDLTEAMCIMSNIFDLNAMKSTLLFEQSNEREKDTKSYQRIQTITESLEMIEDAMNQQFCIKENDDIFTIYENYSQYKQLVDDIQMFVEETKAKKNDIVKDIKDKVKTNKSKVDTKVNDVKEKLKLPGIKFGTKLKIAKDNLRRATENLSAKEKVVSRDIDMGVDRVSLSAKKAITNDNREAVIKGSLLPSASKTIKAAIVAGTVWAISPALAVIGVLGVVGTSKHLQKKERQLILDDIEIELQMVDKYLKLAEDKDDMVAVKTLLQTKRALQRQQQRIKYNMAVQFKEKLPKTPKGSNEYDDD